MDTAIEFERIYNLATTGFPVKLDDNFEKNLATIEKDGKVYYARRINDIIKEVEDYYWVTIDGKVWTNYIGKFKSSSDRKTGHRGMELRTKEEISDKNKLHTYIHRLQMILFNYVENYRELEVNHIDGDPSNNALENLEWVTHEENIWHACDTDLMDGNYIPKDEWEFVLNHFKKVLNGESKKGTKWLCEKYDVGLHMIKRIRDYFIDTGQIDKKITKKMRHIDKQSLSTEKVRKVCELVEKGERNFNISKKLDINKHTLRHLTNGETYKWITNEYDLNTERHPFRKFNLEDIEELKEYIIEEHNKDNLSFSNISDKFNISRPTINKFINWLEEVTEWRREG